MMRWRPRQVTIPDWVVWALFWWVIIPVVAVLWIGVVLPGMIAREKRKLFGPYPDRWQEWFAWKPVKWSFMESDLSGWVWLETIERKQGFYSRDGSVYRPRDTDGNRNGENGEAG